MYNLEGYFWRNETKYHSYHDWKILGYVDLTFCVILVISNTLVILVFSRKTMISPINTIFIHMAITESLASLSYMPRAWQQLIRVTLCAIPEHRTKTWEYISFYSTMASFLFRHIGVWMAVMLATWRYLAILHPFKERHWCNPETTRKLIIFGYIFGLTLMIPLYMTVGVAESYKLLDQKGCSTSNYTNSSIKKTIYEFQVHIEKYPVLYGITSAFYGVFLKLSPSIVLAFISYRLIISLLEIKKRKYTIEQHVGQQADRTTKILVLILALFVIGEVPHGIFLILTACYGPAFFWRYYYYGVEICAALTHIATSFNFIIYFAMSYKFRKTFRNLIIHVVT